MKSLKEGELAFDFGDDWQIIKFDEHPDYRKASLMLSGTKGVDFLGIYGKDLYLIEVKDFRGRKIADKENLLLEVAQKMRDTLACILAFYRTSSSPECWQPYFDLLCKKDTRIKVVFWLEKVAAHKVIRDSYRYEKATSEFSILLKSLKPKLSWLSSHVLVCSQATQGSLPEMEVRDLAASSPTT